MIEFAISALALAASTEGQKAEPIQRCEIRTQAWCLVQGGTYFDVTTLDNDTRVWTLRDRMLGLETIRITEDRACGSYPSDIQEKSEALVMSPANGRSKYIITWSLHRDGSCSLRFELPVTGRKPNEIAYFLVGSIFTACTWDRCPGISLAATPTASRSQRQQ